MMRRHGHEVLYINTTKMLTHLGGGRADGTHEQRRALHAAGPAGAR
jgi:hypothetical protein